MNARKIHTVKKKCKWMSLDIRKSCDLVFFIDKIVDFKIVCEISEFWALCNSKWNSMSECVVEMRISCNEFHGFMRSWIFCRKKQSIPIKLIRRINEIANSLSKYKWTNDLSLYHQQKQPKKEIFNTTKTPTPTTTSQRSEYRK